MEAHFDGEVLDSSTKQCYIVGMEGPGKPYILDLERDLVRIEEA